VEFQLKLRSKHGLVVNGRVDQSDPVTSHIKRDIELRSPIHSMLPARMRRPRFRPRQRVADRIRHSHPILSPFEWRWNHERQLNGEVSVRNALLWPDGHAGVAKGVYWHLGPEIGDEKFFFH